MATLAYDALPAGSDLSWQLDIESVTITASIGDPSARSIRFIRRSAAFRAIPDCVVGVAITSAVSLMLFAKAARGPNLPPIVFPIIAVFVAAIYLLAWKGRFDAGMDLLNEARSQVTILFANSTELRIEVGGPLGCVSSRINASRIVEILPAPITFRCWWAARLPALRLVLKDAEPIDVLPGRDQAELQAVAAMLRRVLAVPERVAIL